jgi:hypothetical protein
MSSTLLKTPVFPVKDCRPFQLKFNSNHYLFVFGGKKILFFKGEREKKKYINLIFFLVVKGTLSLETSNVSLETKQKILITNFFWVWCVGGTTTKMRSTQSSHSVFMFSDCVDLILCVKETLSALC